jgi:hypothetical protein
MKMGIPEMNDPSRDAAGASWEHEIASLLTELSQVQEHLLDHLGVKRELLARGDAEGLSMQHELELALTGRLQACHERRGRLLAEAAREGLPSTSLAQLSDALGDGERHAVLPMLAKASNQARLLRHHSLTNWVLAQQNLLHLSYLIEILVSGGKLRPTYGKEGADSGSGVLVDHAA